MCRNREAMPASKLSEGDEFRVTATTISLKGTNTDIDFICHLFLG